MEPACLFAVHNGGETFMRACFLGQDICVLGKGIALLQSPPLVMDTPLKEPDALPRQDDPPLYYTPQDAASQAATGTMPWGGA